MGRDPFDADSSPSLFQRLSAQFGSKVDPRISLDVQGSAAPAEDALGAPASEHTESSGDVRRPVSSGLLGRLASRPVVGGRYRVDGEIARGGMGAILDVWDQDLRRRLAMKVALGKGESGSSASSHELDPRLLARFLEEAQVTGQLEHPGIVPVHELGMDENGQVFFTMRRVQGRDLEAIFRLVADEREGWTLTRAVGVLQKICEAMAYAHSKGVIHRDLKPANVMVGRFGEVYVMDWGLVRVQGHEDRHDVRVASIAELDDAGIAIDALSDESVETDPREDSSGQSGDALYTMDGDVLGTPAYMPPEQARGDLELLDARSDVYSLGAMLYRLLSGFTPFGDDGQRKNARAILSELRTRPPRPLGALAPTAPVELVAITEKAMSRDPALRYADMAGLGEDLQAFLEQRVVGAHEAGAWAEARKWVRRNRPLAASLAAGLIVLVGGLAFSLLEKQRADDNAALADRRRGEAVASAAEAKAAAQLADANAAEAARNAELATAAAKLAEERQLIADANAAEAARQARLAEETNDFLNNDLLAAVDPEQQGIDVTVREILVTAGDRLEGRFANEPLVEAELRRTIGNSFYVLGDLDAALPHIERAYELRDAELGAKHEETIAALSHLALTISDMARYDRAKELFEEVVRVSLAELGPSHEGTLTSMRHQSVAYSNSGDLERAAEILLAVRAIESEPSHPFSADSLHTAGNLGVLYSEMGRLEEAEVELREALRLCRLIHGEDKLETFTAMSNLSVLLSDMASYDEAYELESVSYTGRLEMLGPDHKDVAQTLVNLGVLDLEQRRFELAEERISTGLEGLRRSLDDDHDRVLLAEGNLCLAWAKLGRLDEAVALRAKNLASLRRVYGETHPTTMLAASNQAIQLLSLGRYAEAKIAHEELLEVQRAVSGADHPSTLTTLENYGNVLYSLEDYPGAIATVEEVLAGRKRALGAGHHDVAKTTFNLGMVNRYAGQPERALVVFEEAAALFEAAVGLENPYGANCFLQMGDLHSEARAYAEARENYEVAVELWRVAYPDDSEIGYLLHQLAYSGLKLGDYDTAMSWVDEALALRTRTLGRDAESTLNTRYLRSGILRKLERYEEAAAEALSFHALMLERHGPDHSEVLKGRDALAKIYADWGKEEEAARWR